MTTRNELKQMLEERISNAHYRRDTEYERSSKRFMRDLAKEAVAPSARILDVGCGTGINAKVFTDLGHTVVGVDLSPVAIERFRARGLNGIVANIPLDPLPMPENGFDMVYASEVIEHCADTVGFLSELYRVLKPNGLMFLSTPNSAFWPYRAFGVLGRTCSELQHPGHVRFFSKGGLARTMEGVGFSIESISARNMYCIIGKRVGDAIAPALKVLGFEKEPRFATGDHFWQLSRFVTRASALWSDTLIVAARKRSNPPNRSTEGAVLE